MPGIFIGRQWRTERRQWLVEVWAEDAEDARVKIDGGEGHAYAYVASEVMEAGPVTDVDYDYNEGMGR